MTLAALALAASAAFASGSADEARRLALAPPAASSEGRNVRVSVFEGAKAAVRLKGRWAGAGEEWTESVTIDRAGPDVRVSGAGASVRSASVELSGGERFCLGSRCFRGALRAVPCGTGVAIVDVVDLEDYLLGVVPGEIGRRLDPRFLEAVKAQAIVARTYTLRALGQYGSKPWDVRDDVRDQVYDGAQGEDPLCTRAVHETSGRILTDEDGRPIDAYYHSGSGGHTADIAEVWPQKTVRPYLRGVPDTAPDGRAWGGAAPTGAWTESWDADDLLAAVRRDLAEAIGRHADPGEVLSLRLEGRDSSGRARRLVVVGRSSTVEVVGDRIRWALRRPAKGRPILRSTRFELRQRGDRYVAEGTGNGHGVGLSQNGAMGRAFAGQDCERILHAYYPGTILRNHP